MSEYQYYEFMAVDRLLTQDDMAALRKITSRAEITPNRLMNEYHWGDFKGDPLKLMEQYFDAFVYVANWGTHHFMLRVPRLVLDRPALAPYFPSEFSDVHDVDDLVILEYRSEEEDLYWEESGEGWMARLLPLREEIMSGDLRPLYLGWLNGADMDALEDLVEPPVPPGLKTLSAAQKAMVEFLRIDVDVVSAAAERSAGLSPAASEADDVRRWIREMPETDKTEILLHAVEGQTTNVRAELLHRFRAAKLATAPRARGAEGTRTLAQLLTLAETHAEKRERAEAQRKAREQERKAREAAAAREKHLGSITGHEDELWLRVQQLVSQQSATAYDEAVRLLVDLRDLATRSDDTALFKRRVQVLRSQLRPTSALLKRMDKAGL